MGTTSKYDLRFSGANDVPDGADQLENLAEDIDFALHDLETTKLPLDPIGWTDVPLVKGANGGAGNSRHRVRRHANGLVEFQLDVDVTGAVSGDILAGPLPSWARPLDHAARFRAATSSASAFLNAHVDINTAGNATVAAAGLGATDWVAIVAVYTP